MQRFPRFESYRAISQGGQRASTAASNEVARRSGALPTRRSLAMQSRGQIARRYAIMIAVPGNFAHPTLIGFMESILTEGVQSIAARLQITTK